MYTSVMSVKRGPMRSSLGPASALIPARFTWSVITARSPAAMPSPQAPAALVSTTTRHPAVMAVRTANVIDSGSWPS